MSQGNTPLGVTAEYITYLSKLAKGELTGPKDRFFYDLFVDEDRYGPNAPKSVEEAVEKLRGAWWVEKEDVVQFCLSYILSRHSGVIGWYTRYYLVWALQSYLAVHEQVFNRQCGWEDQYRYEMDLWASEEPERVSLDKLLDNSLPYSEYHNYLFYCFSEGHSQLAVAAFTKQHRKIIYEDLKIFKDVLRSKENAY